MDRCISSGGFLALDRFTDDYPAISKLSDQVRELREENARLHQRDAELSSRIANLEAAIQELQRGDSTERKQVPSRDFPVVSRWEDLEIKFISTGTLAVSAPNAITTTMHYNDLGFQDIKRTPKEHTEQCFKQAWHTLRIIAHHNGQLWVTGDERHVSRLKKHVQLINAKFRMKFGIATNPIRISTKMGTRKAWVAEFKITYIKRLRTKVTA